MVRQQLCAIRAEKRQFVLARQMLWNEGIESMVSKFNRRQKDFIRKSVNGTDVTQDSIQAVTRLLGKRMGKRIDPKAVSRVLLRTGHGSNVGRRNKGAMSGPLYRRRRATF